MYNSGSHECLCTNMYTYVLIYIVWKQTGMIVDYKNNKNYGPT